MGYHFITFVQDPLFFKPFDNGTSLAQTLFDASRDLRSLIDRMSVVAHPTTQRDVNTALQAEFPFPVTSVLEETIIRRTSIHYLTVLRRFLEDADERGPLLVLDPENTCLDLESVAEGHQLFQEKSCLVMMFRRVVGWEVRFISQNRKSLLDRLIRTQHAEENYRDAFKVLRSTHPADFRDVMSRKLPGVPRQILHGFPLKISLFSWSFYANLQSCLNTPLKQIRSTQLFDAITSQPQLFQNFPKQIQVELATSASAIPVYSPLPHLAAEIQKRGFYMEESIFRTVLDRIAERSFPEPELIFSCVTGDPFDHPHLKDWLGLMLDRLPYESVKNIVWFSYGGGLTPDLSRQLLEFSREAVKRRTVTNRIEVIFRLDAANPELYGRIRKGADFDRVMDNVKTFLDIKKKLMAQTANEPTGIHCVVAVATTLLEETQDHLDEFMKRWPSRQAIVNRLSKHANPGRQGDSKAMIELQQAKEREFYRDNDPVEFSVIYGPSHFAGQIPVKAVVDYTPLKRFPCRRLMDALTILCDGRVTVCDRVLNPDQNGAVGQIQNSPSLQDLWMAAAGRDMRDAHARGAAHQIPMCAKCNDWYIPL